MSHEALKQAFAKFDNNQSKFARALGTSQQRVSYIMTNANACPADLVLPCERATGVSRHALRPDLHPIDQHA